VASMEKIAGQMKVNKEQVYQQIHQLKQRIDQLINEIAVSFIEQIYDRNELMHNLTIYLYL
jgi:predicted DNA-binding protein YlxM (UPF0122 family)